MSSSFAKGSPAAYTKKASDVLLTAPGAAKYLGRNADRQALGGSRLKGRPGAGPGSGPGSGKDKKTRALLDRHEHKAAEAAELAARAEVLSTTQPGYLEPEGELERTYKVTQRQLKGEVDEQTSRQIYDLSLADAAPYAAAYSREGRSLLLAGRRGHVAVLDALTRGLKMEVQLTVPPNSIKDCTFLHNPTMFALAEKSAVYIYDDKGAEIHQLKDHNDPLQIQFLPHHWLLASVGRAGYLKYAREASETKDVSFEAEAGLPSERRSQARGSEARPRTGPSRRKRAARASGGIRLARSANPKKAYHSAAESDSRSELNQGRVPLRRKRAVSLGGCRGEDSPYPPPRPARLHMGTRAPPTYSSFLLASLAGTRTRAPAPRSPRSAPSSARAA
jgi:hypothetical protein